MTRRTTSAEESAKAAPAKGGQSKSAVPKDASPKAAASKPAVSKPTAPKPPRGPVAPGPAVPAVVEQAPSAPLGQAIARPGSVDEADARYVDARDKWTAAMRAANSGRPADLASLAIAQEAYEIAAAERDRWHTGTKVAVAVDAETRSGIEAAVGQELAWRKVLHPDEPKGGLLSRIRRRLTGG